MVSRLSPFSTVSSGELGVPSWCGVFSLRDPKLAVMVSSWICSNDVHEGNEPASEKTPVRLYDKVHYV
ncbi:hypothetical protein FHETE_8251 [Fusarium heterosporum]|uniref:Uncharacterized protein n=1 Tax=Fusarium heterosporum TaxID=42747 RepID=A0A8H5T3D2_FUSHE|nr:hypothetical protein FHETE_8251 [Fusarium heterosporum]